jgi:hypothetical protein
MTRLALVLLLLTLAAAGCGGNGDSSDSSGTTTSASTNGLPEAVEEKRDEIASAAQGLDYDRLEELLDPKTFTYSFGEQGNPIGYWRRLEGKAETPILGDILPTVLSMPHAKRGDIYVWPSAHAKEQWTEADRRGLRKLYTEKEIRRFERAGAYLGYRVGIRQDGTWLFFVAGD